jgi:hypothetical protein
MSTLSVLVISDAPHVKSTSWSTSVVKCTHTVAICVHIILISTDTCRHCVVLLSQKQRGGQQQQNRGAVDTARSGVAGPMGANAQQMVAMQSGMARGVALGRMGMAGRVGECNCNLLRNCS